MTLLGMTALPMVTDKPLYAETVQFDLGDAAADRRPGASLGLNELDDLRALAGEDRPDDDPADQVRFMGLFPATDDPFYIPASLDACLEIALLVYTAEGPDGWAQVLKRSKTTTRERRLTGGFKPEAYEIDVEENSRQNRLLSTVDGLFQVYAKQTNAVVQSAAQNHLTRMLGPELVQIDKTWQRYFANSSSDLRDEGFDPDDLIIRSPQEILDIGAQAKECGDLAGVIALGERFTRFDKDKTTKTYRDTQENKKVLGQRLMAYGHDHPIVTRIYTWELPKEHRVIFHRTPEVAVLVAQKIAETLRESWEANLALNEKLEKDPTLVWKIPRLIERSCRMGVDGALLLPERSFAYQAALKKAGLPPRMTATEIAQLVHAGVAASLALFVMIRVIAATNPIGWAIYVVDLLLAIYRAVEIYGDAELIEQAHKAVLLPTQSIANAPDWSSTYFHMLFEALSLVK